MNYKTYLDLCPLEHEINAVAEFVGTLVGQQGMGKSVVHILSVSAGETAEIVAAKKIATMNTKLSCSTAPHCMFFGVPELEEADSRFKSIPLIRDEKSQQSLVEALATGRIELLSSQHFPTSHELKHGLNFTRAMPGATSQG
jgi:dihydroorotase-like cyclic amidohydrolase